MEIKISLTNKWLYSIIFVFVILIVSGVVYAYNSGYTPDVMGHSAEEIEIEPGVTLETKITNIENEITNLGTGSIDSISIMRIEGQSFDCNKLNLQTFINSLKSVISTTGGIRITKCYTLLGNNVCVDSDTTSNYDYYINCPTGTQLAILSDTISLDTAYGICTGGVYAACVSS